MILDVIVDRKKQEVEELRRHKVLPPGEISRRPVASAGP